MSLKKKVIINASMVDEKPTGVGMVAINIINYLINESSLDISILCPTDIHFRDKSKVIKVSPLLMANRYGKLAAIYRFLWNQVIYPFYASKYDIAYSPTTHGSVFLGNQIITIHDLISFQYPETHRLQRLYFKMVLPIFLRRSKKIITISNEVKKSILSYFPKASASHIEVVYNGYDDLMFLEKETANIKEIDLVKSGDFILSVGPTYAHKNFERLILAYNKLPLPIKSRYPLYIVSGREPYLSHIKGLVKANDLEMYVKFLGYISTEKLSALYRRGTALIYLSLYEGFGLPPIEAMACGCFVIASNVSSIPEVCGAAAYYVDPLNIDEIAEGMKLTLESAVLRKQYVDKGLQRVKIFKWEDSFKKILTLISDNYQ